MINEDNREQFFQTFEEMLSELKKLEKNSDNERVRNYTYKHCVNVQYLLGNTDNPRIFRSEITKLRLGWDSISSEVFEFEEAESVNIVLSKLERMVVH